MGDHPKRPRSRARALALALPLTLSALALATPRAARADVTERVTVDQSGEDLPQPSEMRLSRDGRVAAFMVDPPRERCKTVFVRDVDAGETACATITIPPDFDPARGVAPLAVSFTGRFVALRIEHATTHRPGLFLWDRETLDLERIDVASDGTPSLGATLVSATISRDGRFVAFDSSAPDLVPGDQGCTDFFSCVDVFVRDRTLGLTERVSIAHGGGSANSGSLLPSISDDGRFVAFESRAGDLVLGGRPPCDFPAIVRRCTPDAYLFDRAKRRTTRVVPPQIGRGQTGRAMVGASGRYIDFVVSRSGDLGRLFSSRERLYRYDLQRRTTRLLFEAPDQASVELPASEDGRIVAFSGYYLGVPYLLFGVEVRDLVPGAFVHDGARRRSRQIDVAPDGSAPITGELNSFGKPKQPYSYPTGVSASGDTVGFVSDAANLVPNDTNGEADAFVRYLEGVTPD